VRNAEYVLLVVKDASSVYYHVLLLLDVLALPKERKGRDLGGDVSIF
jgi:hypothetical protein